MSTNKSLIEQLLSIELDKISSHESDESELVLAQAELRFHHLMNAIYSMGRSLNRDHHLAIASQTPPISTALLRALNQTHEDIAQNIEKHYEQTYRGYRKTNHSHYYYRLERALLAFMSGDISKCKHFLNKAREFVSDTSACETDGLKAPVTRLEEAVDSTALRLKDYAQSQVPEFDFPQKLNIALLEQLTGSSRTKSATALSRFHQDKLARFFIDPQQQQPRCIAPLFHWEETEPGSTQAIKNAIHWILKTASQPLTVEYIQQLHKLVSTDVKGLTGRGYSREAEENGPGQFRTIPVKFGRTHGISTSIKGEEAIVAFAKKANTILNKNAYHYHKDGIGCRAFSYGPASITSSGMYMCFRPDAGDIKKLLEVIIEEYRDSIAQAALNEHNVRDIIKSCVSLVRQLSLIHPFSDCNLRTSQQLLNKLLLENNLPLTILREPGMIEGLSDEELVDEVLQGMRYFEHFRQHNYFPTTEPSPAERDCVFAGFISQAAYLALAREKRQILSHHRDMFLALLRNGAVPASILFYLSVKELFLLSQLSTESQAILAKTPDSIEQYLLLPVKLKHQLLKRLPKLNDFLVEFGLTLNDYFKLQPETQQCLIRYQYEITQYIQQGEFASINELLALRADLLSFLLDKSYTMKDIKKKFNLSLKQLVNVNVDNLRLFDRWRFADKVQSALKYIDIPLIVLLERSLAAFEAIISQPMLYATINKNIMPLDIFNQLSPSLQDEIIVHYDKYQCLEQQEKGATLLIAEHLSQANKTALFDNIEAFRHLLSKSDLTMAHFLKISAEAQSTIINHAKGLAVLVELQQLSITAALLDQQSWSNIMSDLKLVDQYSEAFYTYHHCQIDIVILLQIEDKTQQAFLLKNHYRISSLIHSGLTLTRLCQFAKPIQQKLIHYSLPLELQQAQISLVQLVDFPYADLIPQLIDKLKMLALLNQRYGISIDKIAILSKAKIEVLLELKFSDIDVKLKSMETPDLDAMLSQSEQQCMQLKS